MSDEELTVVEELMEYCTPKIEGNVIYGVKISGTKSRNGRTYPPEVLRDAMNLYESAPVYLLHADSKEKREGTRKTWDHFGHLQNIRERGNLNGQFGIFGDLHVKMSHPMAHDIIHSAPTATFGLSQHADVRLDPSKTIARKIVCVRSVDLVDNPATHETLFEERETMSEETTETIGSLAKAMDAHFAALEKRLDALDKKPVEITEEVPPKKKNARETILEQVGEDQSVQPEAFVSGDTHEDFMRCLQPWG